MWRIETPRWIMPSATMICSLVSFTPVSPRRWSGPETAHYKRFVNPRCAKLGVPREAKWRVLLHAHLLTNIAAIHALTAWRLYNRGAVVEHRIAELAQLGIGKTAVDDLGGNRLLWAMGALAYQLLHVIRTTALTGSWRRAQPERIRSWILR